MFLGFLFLSFCFSLMFVSLTQIIQVIGWTRMLLFGEMPRWGISWIRGEEIREWNKRKLVHSLLSLYGCPELSVLVHGDCKTHRSWDSDTESGYCLGPTNRLRETNLGQTASWLVGYVVLGSFCWPIWRMFRQVLCVIYVACKALDMKLGWIGGWDNLHLSGMFQSTHFCHCFCYCDFLSSGHDSLIIL